MAFVLDQLHIPASMKHSDSCVQVLGFTLINSTVALVGYYAAAFTVDKAWMGRRRMQIMGFAWMFVLFMLCAWQYRRLTQPSHLWIFRALYYLSR